MYNPGCNNLNIPLAQLARRVGAENKIWSVTIPPGCPRNWLNSLARYTQVQAFPVTQGHIRWESFLDSHCNTVTPPLPTWSKLNVVHFSRTWPWILILMLGTSHVLLRQPLRNDLLEYVTTVCTRQLRGTEFSNLVGWTPFHGCAMTRRIMWCIVTAAGSSNTYIQTATLPSYKVIVHLGSPVWSAMQVLLGIASAWMLLMPSRNQKRLLWPRFTINWASRNMNSLCFCSTQHTK